MKTFAIMGLLLSWLFTGCSPSKPRLNEVLVDGKQIKAHSQKATIQILQLGQIEFRSGRVSPKDTMMLDIGAELDRTVPISAGNVEAVIAKFASGDERIAFLRVKFSSDLAERYALAIRKIGPSWHESYREAYPVDSGFGGFVDFTIQEEVNGLFGAEEKELTKRLHKELELQSKPTWSWSNFEVKPGARIIVASSGFGDGGYRTFYGLNSKDEIVSLVTDFNVITTELTKE